MAKVTKVTGDGVSEGLTSLPKVTKVTGGGGSKPNKVTLGGSDRDGGGAVAWEGPSGGGTEVEVLAR